VLTVLESPDTAPDPAVERKLHKTIRQVTEQIPALGYNTAIAAMMEHLNAVRAGGRSPARAEVVPLVPMVAPFAPHMAEELWSRLGNKGSVFDDTNWPDYDAEKAKDDSLELPVQVNGKVRGRVLIEPGATQDAVVGLARSDENVARHLDGVTIKRVIYVPDRLLNFVVGPN
jgi:leucyl-tRNA synthetase